LIKGESEVTAMENGTRRIKVKRRAFVVGAGNAVLGCGLLSACGSQTGSATATGPQEPTTAATPVATSAASNTAATSTAPPVRKTPVDRGMPLGKASVVPLGGGTVFAAQRVVVTQPQAGRYVGLSAVCTHQGCVVADVDGGTINCPCHGSRYHLDGTVARGPAPRPLAPRHVTVVDGELELG